MSLPNNKSDDEPVINTPDKPVINTPDKPVINTPDKPLNAISFGFKKISQNKVDLSNIVKTDDKVYREKKTPSKSSSTRVIPLIEKNRWRNLDKLDDLDKQAVEELMKDSISSVTTSHQQVNEEKLDYSIPMLLRNRAPDGFDNADKLDVSIYPEEVRALRLDDVITNTSSIISRLWTIMKRTQSKASELRCCVAWDGRKDRESERRLNAMCPFLKPNYAP